MPVQSPFSLPLAQLVRSRSTEPEHPALLTFVSHDERGEYRVEHRHYASLWRRGQALARAFSRRGLRGGERLALLMQNHAEFVDAMVASSILGTVLVPIDPRTRGRKLAYMLDSVGCKAVLAAPYCLESLREVAGQAPGLVWTWLVGRPDDALDLPLNSAWLAHEARDEGEELAIAGDDPEATMQLLFTSGTTGDPKAIIGSYARYAAVAELVRHFGVGQDDRMYTGLSLTHSNAQAITLGGALYNGIPVVISQRFTKSRLWQQIRDFRCTTLNLLGGMFTAIYSEPARPDDANNPLRLVISSGMPHNLWEPFARRFGVRILEVYGAAEGGVMINRPGEGPIGSIGKPLPGLVARIVDDEDRECAPLEPGEIVFENADGSAPRVTYYRNPEASREKTRRNRLRMGDVGFRDTDGWFYFLHRKGSELRRNGDFISPGFVEKEMAEHPNVSEVVVYGVPSANGVQGEKDIVAAVVPRDPQAWDPSSLFAFCESRLERNSVPSYLQLVEEVPKTASEKPLDRLLRDAFSPRAPNVFARMDMPRRCVT